MSGDLRGAVLPTAELRGRIREAAFALLLTHHRPVSVDELATLTGVTAATLNDQLDELAAAGSIDRDGQRRVTGSAGLSLETGPHRLQIDGTVFRTWCAYDSIGIAAALHANAQIETECPVCGRSIEIRIHDGQPPTDGPERLWLASGGSSLRGDFCDPTVLLCSPDHAATWAEQQAGHGRAVSLTEAAALGTTAWASCAATAVRLASS